VTEECRIPECDIMQLGGNLLVFWKKKTCYLHL